MKWLQSKADSVATVSTWFAALCGFTCAGMPLFPISNLWICGVGLAGGASGLMAVWASGVASRRRDEELAIAGFLATTAIETIHAQAPHF